MLQKDKKKQMQCSCREEARLEIWRIYEEEKSNLLNLGCPMAMNNGLP